MRFNRQFTEKNNDAYSGLEFKTTTSEIKNPMELLCLAHLI